MAKAKQEYLDGMKPGGDKKLDGLMDLYVEARDSRMALTETEVERRKALELEMGKKELKAYRHSDGSRVVEIKASEEKAKVTTVSNEPEEE